jgi:hypothetical protein
MPHKKAMIAAARAYLREHPEELLRIARNAIAMRVGVPLDALRWLVGQAKGPRTPSDVVIEGVPPGVRLSASVALMGTPIRASAIVYVEVVRLSAHELRIELRLAEVSLTLLDPSADTPIAALIKSGALDLSKPGNLVAYMPKRPAVLVEAHDDRIVLDLKRHPKLSGNGKLERTMGVITPLVSVDAVQADAEHLDLLLRAFPDGFATAVASLREYL